MLLRQALQKYNLLKTELAPLEAPDGPAAAFSSVIEDVGSRDLNSRVSGLMFIPSTLLRLPCVLSNCEQINRGFTAGQDQDEMVACDHYLTAPLRPDQLAEAKELLLKELEVCKVRHYSAAN